MAFFLGDERKARRVRRPRPIDRIPAGFFDPRQPQPVNPIRRIGRRRPPRVTPPRPPKIGAGPAQVPTDEVRRRLAEMRRRVSRGSL